MISALTRLLPLALGLASLASFCVLLAGAQIPRRLRWREELALLTPFNRKIVWTYYAFVGGTIACFGMMTLVLRDEMVRGDRSAVVLAAFMAAWWVARILVDAFWYSRADWPKGRGFALGHALLTFAFVAMALTYIAVVAVALAA